MTKPVVKYSMTQYSFVELGQRASVLAFEHPGNEVMEAGTKEVLTSTVIKYDEDTGDFETRNTLYQLATDI